MKVFRIPSLIPKSPWFRGGASSLQASSFTPKGTLFVHMWAVIGRVACSRSHSPKHAAGAYVSVCGTRVIGPALCLVLKWGTTEEEQISLHGSARGQHSQLLLAWASPVLGLSRQAHPSHHSRCLVAAGMTQPAKCLGKSPLCRHMSCCLAKCTVPMGSTCTHSIVDGLCAAWRALGIHPLGA